MAPHIKMLLGFGVGVVGGVLANLLLGGDAPILHVVMNYITGPIGQIFLRLLYLLVIPLVFSALITGIAALGDVRSLGRVGARMAWFTVTMTSIAVAIGMVLVNVIRPGDGFADGVADSLIGASSGRVDEIIQAGEAAASGANVVVGLVPTNIVAAMANNDLLGIIFFAICFGLALVVNDTAGTRTVLSFMDGVMDASMTLIGWVIATAPIAVACLVFNSVALFGFGLLIKLGSFVGVALLAMGLHSLVVYPLVLRFVAMRAPGPFFWASREALLMAFSTSSSSATLPTTLRVAEESLGLPSRVTRFVVTLGATANQNATALFEGITVLFLAQLAGVPLDVGQQLLIMFMCIVGGIGTAGIPAGSLPVIAMICGVFGIPPQGLGIILGVDRFLDMCRTTVNVGGDLVAAAVVSRGYEDEAPPSGETPLTTAETALTGF